MKESRDPPRITGEAGLKNLADFTRRILAVPKAAISERMKEPIYKPRKRRLRRRRVPK